MFFFWGVPNFWATAMWSNHVKQPTGHLEPMLWQVLSAEVSATFWTWQLTKPATQKGDAVCVWSWEIVVFTKTCSLANQHFPTCCYLFAWKSNGDPLTLEASAVFQQRNLGEGVCNIRSFSRGFKSRAAWDQWCIPSTWDAKSLWIFCFGFGFGSLGLGEGPRNRLL